MCIVTNWSKGTEWTFKTSQEHEDLYLTPSKNLSYQWPFFLPMNAENVTVHCHRSFGLHCAVRKAINGNVISGVVLGRAAVQLRTGSLLLHRESQRKAAVVLSARECYKYTFLKVKAEKDGLLSAVKDPMLWRTAYWCHGSVVVVNAEHQH